MRIGRFLAGAGLAALLALPAGAAEQYTIDTVHSTVQFTATHMVISKVKGFFRTVEGTIEYAPEHPERSLVKVRIDAASIDTRNDKRDAHLRSADFLDAEKYPDITFVSTKVERAGDRWLAHGTLTIRGVSKPVTIPFTVNGPITDPWGNRRIGIEAEPITINRQDFGVSWNKTLDTGGLVVGDDVQIDLDVEAAAPIEKPAAQEGKKAS